MNIFYIPSWYPPKQGPPWGNFFKEYAFHFALQYPDVNVGISLWGQKEEKKLLWAKDHVKNIAKIIHHYSDTDEKLTLLPNLKEYYSPALTWSMKFFKGNIESIIEANEKNLLHFEKEFGKSHLIHAQVAYPAGYIAMRLAKKHQLPFVLTEHMSPFPFQYFIKENGQLIEQVSQPFLASQKVTTVSDSLAQRIQQFLPVKPEVIPNLIDNDFFVPAPAKNMKEPFTFFTLGRIVHQKGIPSLLEAISLLTKNHKNVRFRIGGSGEQLSEYKSLAIKLGVDAYVDWLGALLNKQLILQEYQNCSAFVLPSLHESQGVVFLEALACGKPVIATRCGGPESIVNNINGLLVAINNPVELACAMEKLVNEQKNYSASSIRQDFMERFSKEKICSEMHVIYNQIIGAASK